METNYASPKLKTDTRAQSLITRLIELERPLGIVEGVIYYDYPLFRDTDNVLYRTKVMLASRSHGILIFGVGDLDDRSYSTERVAALDDELAQLHSIIFGKLLKSRRLRRSVGELSVRVRSLLFLPDLVRSDRIEAEKLESEVLVSLRPLEDKLSEARQSTLLQQDAWEELRSIIEGARGILRPRERDLSQSGDGGKAALLRSLEAEVANFDANQRRAAIAIVDGPQRIRGLAGSGKTVVLAMKAAHIHLSDPTTDILFTFYTKSLYDFIRRLITRFYRQFNDRDPDWSKVHVLHGWGGKSVGGVYYNACLDAGVTPLTLREAAAKSINAFDYACGELLRTRRVSQRYDYVLIDEAQDFPPAFFRLCFDLCRGGQYDRNIVWAYDELQNIINVKAITPAEAFGTDKRGAPLIDLDRTSNGAQPGFMHDIVLHKCYRNPREILVAAHALGFGIYSDTIVQMLENKEHWEDVGYVVEQGDCLPGQSTVINRPKENSPLAISDQQTPAEMIATFVAEDVNEEVSWVVQSIAALIEEGLRPDDIMVVALDDRNARPYFQWLSAGLAARRIQVNDVLSDPYGEPAFLIENQVTLTTVYRAKGNEAPVVFAIGMEALYPTRKFQRTRNKLFTAFTRAKGWLRMSGIGDGARFFVREIDVARENLPRLKFIYPDPERIVTLQRDLSDKAAKLARLQAQLDQQLEFLELDDEERQDFLASLINKKQKKQLQ